MSAVPGYVRDLHAWYRAEREIQFAAYLMAGAAGGTFTGEAKTRAIDDAHERLARNGIVPEHIWAEMVEEQRVRHSEILRIRAKHTRPDDPTPSLGEMPLATQRILFRCITATAPGPPWKALKW